MREMFEPTCDARPTVDDNNLSFILPQPKGHPGYAQNSQILYPVLDFWFGPKSSPSYLQQKSFWYGSPEDDAYVHKHLDQVPRNILRGTPQAYATDAKAVTVARYAVDKGWDRRLPDVQRRFFYSPFNYSEDLEDQETSVRLFTELGHPYH
ncbi:hypothetical protein BDV06DRAFT_222891 [Aspergillus oleicola]